MNKETAKKLVPFVNAPEFQEFINYLSERITFYHEALEWDLNEKHQGAIAELRRIKDLRTAVLATLGKLDEKGNPKGN